MKKNIVTFFTALFVSSVVFAEVPAGVPVLSPDIQKNFEKGMSAAKQKDYDLAIRYFNDVFEAAPLYPLVYFNLGLAHANAGHELAAIAWFKAYLQADPKVSNRRDIEKAITDQEVAAESEGRKIIEQAEQAANALPDDGTDYSERKQALSYVSNALSSSGDMDAGIKLAEKYQLKTYSTYKADALATYVNALANGKRNDEALELVKQLPEDKKQAAFETIMYSYQIAGVLDKAMMVFRMLPKPGDSYYTTYLAQAFAKNGDWNEAEVITEKISTDKKKFEALLDLAGVARSVKNSSKNAEMISKAERILPTDDNTDSVNKLAQAYVESGDNSKTLKLLDSNIPTPDANTYTFCIRAGLYAKAGEFGKAEQIFSTISKPDDQNWAAREMIVGFLKKKDFKKAKSYLKYLTTGAFVPFDIGGGYANVAWALIKDGKESEARKIMNDIPKGSKFDQEPYMYMRLAEFAAKDHNYKLAYEFVEKTSSEDWRGSSVGSVADSLINDKRYEEAITFLEKNTGIIVYSGNVPLFDYWFRVVDELENSKKHEEAVSVMDRTANAALGKRDLAALEKCADYYKKFGDKEHQSQVREWINDLKWPAYAKELEKARTYNPAAAYKEIQKNPNGQYIPSDMAVFGTEYLNTLNKIGEMGKS